MSTRSDAATATRRRTARASGASVVASILCAITAWTGAVASPQSLADRGWVWPARSFVIERAYAAPAHEYGPGHHGIDLLLVGEDVVRAPAAGVVAFAGTVAGRALLTIDHGEGLVTTLEPVTSDLVEGSVIARADEVGSLALGGHSAAGSLHFGVRLDGDYINPMLLLGGVPRAVLLPCC